MFTPFNSRAPFRGKEKGDSSFTGDPLREVTNTATKTFKTIYGTRTTTPATAKANILVYATSSDSEDENHCVEPASTCKKFVTPPWKRDKPSPSECVSSTNVGLQVKKNLSTMLEESLTGVLDPITLKPRISGNLHEHRRSLGLPPPSVHRPPARGISAPSLRITTDTPLQTIKSKDNVTTPQIEPHQPTGTSLLCSCETRSRMTDMKKESKAVMTENSTRNKSCQTSIPSNTNSPISCKPNQAEKSVSAPTTSEFDETIITVNGKRYSLLSKLGAGGSSKVERVVDFAEGRVLALKTVSLVNQPPTAIASFRKEITMLEKLQTSDRVITMYDYEYKSDRLLILLECGDIDLAQFLRKKYKEDCILDRHLRCVYWKGMLRAVKDLHEIGIIHSDIKPANFMLVAGEIKLIDFGIAKQLEGDMTSMLLESCMGSFNYMPPEVLESANQTSDQESKTGRKADVWSLGCLLYYMAYGHTPFEHITRPILKMTAITSDSHVIPYEDIGEPQLLQTLQACLVRNPKERASIDALLAMDYCK